MNANQLFRVIDGKADSGREATGLVHGSWTDHAGWQSVRPKLAPDHASRHTTAGLPACRSVLARSMTRQP